MERRADRLPPRQMVSWLLHFLADYGFNPWKTIGWSLVVVFACGWLFAVAANCGWSCPITVDTPAAIGQASAVKPPSASSVEPPPATMGDFYAIGAGNVFSDTIAKQSVYPEFNAWLYSLDQFIPILNLGMDDFWRPQNEGLYIVSILEQFVGAFLVALAITGFTGLLTHDEHS